MVGVLRVATELLHRIEPSCIRIIQNAENLINGAGSRLTKVSLQSWGTHRDLEKANSLTRLRSRRQQSFPQLFVPRCQTLPNVILPECSALLVLHLYLNCA